MLSRRHLNQSSTKTHFLTVASSTVCDRGEGVKKSEIFADLIYGSPLIGLSPDPHFVVPLSCISLPFTLISALPCLGLRWPSSCRRAISRRSFWARPPPILNRVPPPPRSAHSRSIVHRGHLLPQPHPPLRRRRRRRRR